MTTQLLASCTPTSHHRLAASFFNVKILGVQTKFKPYSNYNIRYPHIFDDVRIGPANQEMLLWFLVIYGMLRTMKHWLKRIPDKLTWKHRLAIGLVISALIVIINTLSEYSEIIARLQSNGFNLLGDAAVILLALPIAIVVGLVALLVGYIIASVEDRTVEAAPKAMLQVDWKQVKLFLDFLVKFFSYIFKLFCFLQLPPYVEIAATEKQPLTYFPSKLNSPSNIPYQLYPLSCMLIS